VTLVLLEPVTLAKNCCVLGEPPEAATKGYAGETATLTSPDETATVIDVAPVREASA
jgi:hypothetical protein